MRYIKYSDPIPQIAGIEFGWARESRYPTNNPEYFGTVPDEADIDVPGVIHEFNQADYDNMRLDEMNARKVSSVSIRQAREALKRKGYFDKVDAAFNAIPDPTEKDIALNWWDYSLSVDRDNPYVLQMLAVLGLDEQQGDDLFSFAKTL